MRQSALVVALGALALAGAAAGMTQNRIQTPKLNLGAALGGRPLDVQVYIPQMQCAGLSKEEGIQNDRDETYVLFRGQGPSGLLGARLPRQKNEGGYYEFVNTEVNDREAEWTNEDQAPVGRPIIWTGRLNPGQSAEFVVTVIEQDNAELFKIKQGVQSGIDAAEKLFGSNPYAKAAIEIAKPLVAKLPEIKGHELIGAFIVRAQNEGGMLRATFVPVNGTMTVSAAGNVVEGVGKRENAQTALFDMTGEKNLHYRAFAAVRVGPALPERTYISRETDQSGQALLAVEGGPAPYKGYYHVAKGGEAWVPVEKGRFFWYSGTTLEATTAPNGTNVVHVKRSGSNREITWYCYEEKGTRPVYKPTQNYVKLSTETDQCGGKLLAVEGMDGFYHLGAGGQKFVPMRDRRFTWYCDTTREAATAPEGTNLVIAKRDPKTRQITWECCKDIVSLRPYARPDDTKVLLSSETDQGSAERIQVFGDGGFYAVGKGQEKWVPVTSPRFNWLNETSVEATTAPEGTNLVQVRRSPTSREITWMCYRSVASTVPFRRPDTTEVFLGTEIDQSGEKVIKVMGASGGVDIRKGETKEVPVKENRFRWMSGGSEEFTTAPKLTNYVKASREKDGRKITWKCYLRR